VYQHTGVVVLPGGIRLGTPTRAGKDEIIEKVRPKFDDKYMVVDEPTSTY
jgi:hypothetical protein